MRCSIEEPVNNVPANKADEYVKCPYFPEHELRRSRLPYHLIKCQKNPMAPKLVACPFNYLHRVRPEDKQEHVLLCEDKLLVKYTDRNPPSFATTLKQVHGITPDQLVPPNNSSTSSKTDDGEEWW